MTRIFFSGILILLLTISGHSRRLRIDPLSLLERHLAPEVTANSTNTTPETLPSEDRTQAGLATTISVVHPSLQFPVSQKVSQDQDFASNYCQTATVNGASKTARPIGTGDERYSTAVAEAIARAGMNGTVTRPRESSFLQSPADEIVLTTVSALKRQYGSCSADSECDSLSPRKYCVDSICRECKPSSRATDCPNSHSDELCSEFTEFTCSECLDDDYCSEGVCRFVFPSVALVPMMPRKQCTLCDVVPLNGEITNVAACEWRCPLGTVYDGNTCAASPQCDSSTEYLAPSGEETELYFSPGVNMTDAVCGDCMDMIGREIYESDSFCANLVPEKKNGGNLSSDLPCGSFECRQGWTLTKNHDQCERCDFGKCVPG
jgi:hypothetical protein